MSDPVLTLRKFATSEDADDRDEVSYRGQLDYTGDRYGVQLERLVVGTDFNPEVGFLRRSDFERSFGSFRFSPRPQSIAAIRKFSWEGQFDYITDRDGVLETREVQGRFRIEFESSDNVNGTYSPRRPAVSYAERDGRRRCPRRGRHHPCPALDRGT